MTGEAVAVLNQCLAGVMGWMRANKLRLNPDKMEVLLSNRTHILKSTEMRRQKQTNEQAPKEQKGSSSD
ncbi:GPN-loop GTPase 3 [Varanus komodoensis]|nr:GPN-loop GTPase 3 [Varanus komodoensis]